MPVRPLWRGHLKLSLVSCPVALYGATTDAENIRFNQINPKTGNRIRQQVVDAETGDEVERADLVHGYQFAKDRYVIVSDEEIDDLKIDSSSTMAIERFVAMAEVPSLYFETAYYLAPDGDAGHDAFAVIREAMRKEQVYGLARAVISRRERVMALAPSGPGLIAHGLREEREIRDEGEIFDEIDKVKPDADMLAIAAKIVQQKRGSFDVAAHEDRYQARLRALLDSKLKGVELEPEDEDGPPDNVIDLMDALKKSLSAKGGAGRAKADKPDTGATVHKLPAKKTAAPKKTAPAKPARKPVRAKPKPAAKRAR